MRLVRAAIAAGAIAATAPAAHAAQGVDDSDLLALRSVISVRSAGLNGAGAALVGDASSVFSNPAGLATIRNVALEASIRTTPLDGYVAAGALGWRLKQFNLGLGFHYFDRGVRLADSLFPDPTDGDRSGSYEGMGVGSLIYRFGIIAFGGSVKLIRDDGPTYEVRRATGIDVGMAIPVFDIMELGFSMQNVGGNLRGNQPVVLPRLTRFGFTMNYVDPLETWRLLSTLEIQWPEGRSARVILGAEAGMVLHDVGVRIRAGYTESETADIGAELTWGASVELGQMDIDYVRAPRSLLDRPTQRFGLRLRL